MLILFLSGVSFIEEINPHNLSDEKKEILKKFREYRLYSLAGSLVGITLTMILLIWFK
jgi:hypothetical protein